MFGFSADEGSRGDVEGSFELQLRYRKYVEEATTSGESPMPFEEWVRLEMERKRQEAATASGEQSASAVQPPAGMV